MSSSLDFYDKSKQMSAEDQMHFWRKFRYDSPTEPPNGRWRDYLRKVPCKRCGEWAKKYSLWWTEDELHMTETFSHHSEDSGWHWCRMDTDLRQSSAECRNTAAGERDGSQDTAVAMNRFGQACQRSLSAWYTQADWYVKPERKKKNTRRGNMRKRWK